MGNPPTGPVLGMDARIARRPPASRVPCRSLLVVSAVPATTVALSREAATRGTRLIDSQRPALEGLTIQSVDRPLRVFALRQLNETESPRCTCHFVLNDRGRCYTEAGVGDEFIQTAVRGAVRQISYIK